MSQLSETAGVTASTEAPPASAVSQSLSLLSLVLAFCVYLLFDWAGWHDPETAFLCIILAVAAPHVVFRLPVPVSQSAVHAERAARRVRLKVTGLAATYVLIAVLLFAFKGFATKYYVPLIEAYPYVWIPVAILAVPYIWFTDRRMAEPEDGLYHFGLLATGHMQHADMAAVRQYLLGWVVKAFFAPLMIRFALDSLQWFFKTDVLAEIAKPHGYFTPAYKFLYMVDVWFAFTGYLFTLRLFNTHIRSVEPTMFGWVVCLICYPPFYAAFENNFANYEEGFMWGHWASGLLWHVWGLLILACVTTVAWTTVSFGITFSNLTHRGIITNGPYRWSRHPSYIAKNLSWWLISIPFITNGPWYVAIGNCIALLLWNGVYYLRARTEERHLGADPAYLAYERWIAENGVLARLRRRAFPK